MTVDLDLPKTSPSTRSAVSDLTQSNCPACKAAQSVPIWPDSKSGEFRLRRCAACGLAFTDPVPSDLSKYYPPEYYGRRNVRFNKLMESMVSWFRRRRSRKLCAIRKPGRVLDVGCGRGHFLANLRSCGWQAEGVELSDAAVGHARDALGLDVRVGAFDPDDYPEEHFDAVVFWHVLEHLPDPTVGLDAIGKIIKPGGLLIIAVPNLASWQAALTRYGWFHLDLPRHLSHFEESWLIRKLEGLGYRITEVNHFSFEQNPFGWIQSLLNAFGIRRNLLYDILKSPGARSVDHPLRRYPVQSVLSLIGFALLLPFACAMLIPESLLRRGPTIELYAEWPGELS
jgi:2-polyprenyl-3-methyl-5-hydroxy-6-metoxy-1,4-benzoquinol methylase/Zn ribbon nucleic-acid-binding protein